MSIVADELQRFVVVVSSGVSYHLFDGVQVVLAEFCGLWGVKPSSLLNLCVHYHCVIWVVFMACLCHLKAGVSFLVSGFYILFLLLSPKVWRVFESG